MRASVFNPLRGIPQVKDSLSILSQQQIDRLTILKRQMLAKQYSIWAPVVTYLSSLPDHYNLDEAVEHIQPARGRLRRDDRRDDTSFENLYTRTNR